jgi:hemerythrin-like domain-containing protein
MKKRARFAVLAGPIGVLLLEHDAGRGHVKAMSQALERLRSGEATALKALLHSARAYRDLLRAHIRKENTTLFPMADRLLPDDVAAGIIEDFEEIERDRVGEGKHEAYHAMLHTLKDSYGIK